MAKSWKYLNVANFDYYNMIVGMLYMHKHNVILDFQNNQIVVNGETIPAVWVALDDRNGRIYCHRAIEKKLLI